MVFIEKIPFFALSLASSVITILSQHSGKAIASLEVIPIVKRLLVASRALIFYLFKMLWPTDLAPLYQYPSKISLFTFDYMGSFLLLIGITVLCMWSLKKQMVFSAVWAYYIVTLLPVLGIIHVGPQAAANRYTYLPSLGPILLIGLGVSWLWEKADVKQKGLNIIRISIIITSISILSILSILTIKQIDIWSDSIKLWSKELELYNNFIAYFNRADAYLIRGNYNNAIKDIDMAIILNPKDELAYYNRGLAYERLGDYDKAMNNYNMAINLNPRFEYAYNIRGILNYKIENYEQAIQDFNKAIEINSRFSLAFNNRGVVYRTLGFYPQAINDLTRSIELNPNYAISYQNRAKTYLLTGRYEEADKDFKTAARLGDKQAQDYLQSKGMNW